MSFPFLHGPAAHEPCAPPDLKPFALPKGRAGGAYGWMTPYLAVIAAQNAGIAARVLTLPRDEAHFIAMTLSLMGKARDDAAMLGALAQALGRDKREAILARFAPGHDPRLARLAAKLAGRVWRPPTYRRLSLLAGEPHGRKVVAHLPAITRRAVLALTRLPPTYRTRGVLALIRQPDHLAPLVFAIEIVRRVRTDLSDRQIIASLERTAPRRIRDWVEGHYERLPFPPPPARVLTDGAGGVLRPVDTGAALRRTGLDYDNCAADFMARAWRGERAYYRYDRGAQPIAFIEVRQTPGVGWAIDAIEGPKNEAVEAKDRMLIVSAFAAAGVIAAPQALSSLRWFYYD